MAKNQKRGAHALRWQTFGSVLLVVMTLAGMALGYVLQRRAHQRLGEQLSALERRVQGLNAVLDQRRIVHTRLSSAAELRLRIAELHLDLTNIAPSQRLWVQTPSYRGPGAGAAAVAVAAPAVNRGNRSVEPHEALGFQPPLAAATR